MRTFRRRLFAGVSLLSLILCLATVVLWVVALTRSAPADMAFRVGPVQRPYALFRTVDDRLLLRVITKPAAFNNQRPKGAFLPAVRAYWSWAGGFEAYTVEIAYWLYALIFALAPACWLLGPTRGQSKRRKLGLCLNCGYDLRASPDRCPECGSAATS